MAGRTPILRHGARVASLGLAALRRGGLWWPFHAPVVGCSAAPDIYASPIAMRLEAHLDVWRPET